MVRDGRQSFPEHKRVSALVGISSVWPLQTMYGFLSGRLLLVMFSVAMDELRENGEYLPSFYGGRIRDRAGLSKSGE